MNIFVQQAISSKSDKNCIEFDVSDLNAFYENLKSESSEADSNIELKSDNEIVLFDKHVIVREVVDGIDVLYLIKDDKRYLMLKDLSYEFTNENVYVKGNNKDKKLSYYDVYFILAFEIVLYENMLCSNGSFELLSYKITRYVDQFDLVRKIGENKPNFSGFGFSCIFHDDQIDENGRNLVIFKSNKSDDPGVSLYMNRFEYDKFFCYCIAFGRSVSDSKFKCISPYINSINDDLSLDRFDKCDVVKYLKFLLCFNFNMIFESPNSMSFDVSDLNAFYETLKPDSNIEFKSDNEIVLFKKHVIAREIIDNNTVLYLIKDDKRYIILKNLSYEFAENYVCVKGKNEVNKLSYYDVYFIITFEIWLYEWRYFSGCFSNLSNDIKDYIDIFISNNNGTNKKYSKGLRCVEYTHISFIRDCSIGYSSIHYNEIAGFMRINSFSCGKIYRSGISLNMYERVVCYLMIPDKIRFYEKFICVFTNLGSVWVIPEMPDNKYLPYILGYDMPSIKNNDENISFMISSCDDFYNSINDIINRKLLNIKFKDGDKNSILIFDKHLIVREIVDDIDVLYLVKDNKKHLILYSDIFAYELNAHGVNVLNKYRNALSYYYVYFMINRAIISHENNGKYYFKDLCKEILGLINNTYSQYKSVYTKDEHVYTDCVIKGGEYMKYIQDPYINNFIKDEYLEYRDVSKYIKYIFAKQKVDDLKSDNDVDNPVKDVDKQLNNPDEDIKNKDKYEEIFTWRKHFGKYWWVYVLSIVVVLYCIFMFIPSEKSIDISNEFIDNKLNIIDKFVDNKSNITTINETLVIY